MQTLRMFVSSPGDVAEERQLAGKVIERLQGKYWSFVRLDDVFWEEKVVRSTAHYQDELANPGNCDIVVGVLWTRLGSPLPEKFRKASGERYQSGTEWELEMAFDGYERNFARTGDPLSAKPDIVVYRRTSPREVHDDPAREAAAIAQEQALAGYFWQNFMFPDGTIRRPVSFYQTLDEFENQLAGNLEELILRQIPALKPGFEPPPISGSPFKGLPAFDFADSDRYFGRNREIREMQGRLRAAADMGLPFLLIYGGSGYGKSSLMRAGLAPVLTRPGGSLPAIDGWRRVSFQPAKGEGTLCERLARALFLIADPVDCEHSRASPHWPHTGLAELAESLDSTELARCFSDDECRTAAVGTVGSVLSQLNRHLLLELDQLEEVFTTAGIDAAQRGAFFRTVRDLCESGRVWVVATMRSEFFPQIAEQPELLQLVGKERGYILAPPDRQALREMIRYPALAARLDYQRRTTEMEIGGETAKFELLDDQILADAEASPDSLPLLAFTLQQLYEDLLDPADPAGGRRMADLLQWQTYQKAGGLKGSVAKRAREVYDALSPQGKESRHRIFAALVHVDPARHTFARQRAPLQPLSGGPGAGEFIGAFLAARLFVSDEDEQGRHAVITLAHDALISHWDELSLWNKEHQGDLLARQRLCEQVSLWRENGKRKTYLLSEARLAEAQRVATSGLFALTDDELRFLALSAARSRRKLRLLQAAVAVFALLAVVASLLWRESVAQKRTAEIKTREAQVADAKKKENLRLASNADLASALKAWEEDFAARQRGERAAGFAGKSRWHESVALLARALQRYPENRRAAFWLMDTLAHQGPAKWDAEIFALRHDGAVSKAIFSPDGRQILTASDDGTARLWDAQTGKSLGEPMRHDEPVTNVIFSPDGTRAATVGCSKPPNKNVRLWNLKTGKALGEPILISSYGAGLVFSPDGRRVLLDNGDKLSWNAQTGKLVVESAGNKATADDTIPSPDGKRVLVNRDGDTVHLLDARTGKESGEPIRHDGSSVNQAIFSPDGTRVLTASDDKTARLWDARTGKQLGDSMRHDDRVDDAIFSPDGMRVLTASYDKTARLWDAQTGKSLGEPMRHGDGVVSLAFSPDGRRVLTGSYDGTARLWEPHIANSLGEPFRHEQSVDNSIFSPSGRLVLTTSDFKTVLLWDSLTGKLLCGPMKHEGLTNNAVFSPDERRVLLCSNDEGCARWWDVRTGKPLFETMRSGDRWSRFILSPDGRRVLVTSKEHQVLMWDAENGESLSGPIQHAAKVNHVVFSQDGQRILTASDDQTARLWDARTGKPLGEPMRHGDAVRVAIFSPDGQRILTGSDDQTARLWDVRTGKPLGQPMMHEEAVWIAIFSPDGQRILTGSDDQAARLWNAQTGKELCEPMRPAEGFHDAMFSPDGLSVITVGFDNADRLWDAQTGKPICEFMGYAKANKSSYRADGSCLLTTRGDNTAWLRESHTGKAPGEPMWHAAGVESVTFSHDGCKVLTASKDHTARLWYLPSPAILSGLSLASDDVAVLVPWLEAYCGIRFGDDGEMQVIPLDERLAGVRLTSRLPGIWRSLAIWLMDPSPDRPLSIYGGCTIRQTAERERDYQEEGTVASLTSALEYDNTLPLARMLLARALERDDAAKKAQDQDPSVRARVAFLRRHDLNLLAGQRGAIKAADLATLYARAAKSLNDAPKEAVLGIGPGAVPIREEAFKTAEQALRFDHSSVEGGRQRARALDALGRTSGSE